MAEQLITIENTNFITWGGMYPTNLRGDTSRNFRGGEGRNANVLIPEELVDEFIAMGANVKSTKKNEEYYAQHPELEFVPQHFVKMNFNYKPEWPKLISKVHLVKPNGGIVDCDADTVGMIDDMDIQTLDVTFAVKPKQDGDGVTFWVREMYVIQEASCGPLATKWANLEREEMPFC